MTVYVTCSPLADGTGFVVVAGFAVDEDDVEAAGLDVLEVLVAGALPPR